VAAKHHETDDELRPVGPVGIFRDHWRRILLAMILVAAGNTVGYALTSYMPTYLTTNKGYDEIHGTLLTVPVLVAMSLCIPLTGRLSDRIGRRPVYLLGAVGVGLWMFPFFSLIDTGGFGPLILAVTVGLVLHGAMYAPQAAFFSEMFATRMRYSGASIGAQFASVAAGAPAPLIATALLAEYDSSTPIALYVVAAAVLTVIAVAAAKETRHRDLTEIEPSSTDAAPATARAADAHTV
jgi:MFS family permease